MNKVEMTDRLRKRIKYMRDSEGSTIEEIGRSLGICRDRVRQALRDEEKVKPKHKKAVG